ncbi:MULTISPECIES: MFS transporter [unclassified Salinibacterium]|uniref:MFS transporter n=1 Tax=unclassified Salinibacterium TaxID=2632331 RepID=UPI0018CECA0C|nr:MULTISPECIES: MFS transporter [unclassified Salinibacterium]MBH0053638.1 MFS transporter [Salinibacterium sp. SWN139]MBH0082910.1 MFS transporter [Salinibacterium sp. SWN167]
MTNTPAPSVAHSAHGAHAELSPLRRRLILITMALALMTVMSAVSGLNVALPSLAREIGATQTELTWIVDSYTVAFAGLLLAAGAIGDRFGRKGILIIGLAIFGAAAAGAAFTTDANSLIVLRAVMGIGAAGIMPTTLSVITTSFPDAERPKAVGVWVGVAGSGAVLGLFGTGLLLEFFEWHSFFWLNVVLAILGIIGAILVVPPSKEAVTGRFDVLGAALSLIAVSTLVYGIIEIADTSGEEALPFVILGSGLIALVAFVLWERHHPDPLLDPRLFAIRGFSAGSLTIFIQFFAAFGFFFTMLQYLQFVVGLSALQAAACMLPMPLGMVPLARLAPAIAERVGYRKVVPAGLILMAVGFVIMSLLTVDFNYLHFVSGLVVFAAGMGLAGTPSTTAITQSLPREKQGVASAVNDVAREFGSALGIAVLGGVLASVYRTTVSDATTQLPADIADKVQESIAFTQSSMISTLGPAADALTIAARAAFVDATAASLLIAAAALVVTAVATAVIGPRHVRASAVSTPE